MHVRTVSILIPSVQAKPGTFIPEPKPGPFARQVPRRKIRSGELPSMLKCSERESGSSEEVVWGYRLPSKGYLTEVLHPEA